MKCPYCGSEDVFHVSKERAECNDCFKTIHKGGNKMIAEKDLPNNCGLCGHKIMKGQEYVYIEGKNYQKGYQYFHHECYFGCENV